MTHWKRGLIQTAIIFRMLLILIQMEMVSLIRSKVVVMLMVTISRITWIPIVIMTESRILKNQLPQVMMQITTELMTRSM